MHEEQCRKRGAEYAHENDEEEGVFGTEERDIFGCATLSLLLLLLLLLLQLMLGYSFGGHDP